MRFIEICIKKRRPKIVSKKKTYSKFSFNLKAFALIFFFYLCYKNPSISQLLRFLYQFIKKISTFKKNMSKDITGLICSIFRLLRLRSLSIGFFSLTLACFRKSFPLLWEGDWSSYVSCTCQSTCLHEEMKFFLLFQSKPLLL